MNLFLYRKAKKYIDTEEYITAAKLQRKFNIGYAKATEIIEYFEKKSYIKYDKQKWVKK